LERLWQDKGGYREGRFSFYDAFTFRITVGGLSVMLLLNVPFWILSTAYLFHEPLASGMDAVRDVPVVNWVTEYNVDHEGTPLREAIRDWKLQYTEVTDESYTGATVWSVTGQYLTGGLSTEDARSAYAAIDPWSLSSQLLYPLVIVLFLANFIFILLNLIACGVRKTWDLLAQAILAPFYWVLISVGAFKGAWQLCWNPFFWEKTIHGLTPSQEGHPGPAFSPPPPPPLPPSVQPPRPQPPDHQASMEPNPAEMPAAMPPPAESSTSSAPDGMAAAQPPSGTGEPAAPPPQPPPLPPAPEQPTSTEPHPPEMPAAMAPSPESSTSESQSFPGTEGPAAPLAEPPPAGPADTAGATGNEDQEGSSAAPADEPKSPSPPATEP